MPSASPVIICLLKTSSDSAKEIQARFAIESDYTEPGKSENLLARALLRKLLSEQADTTPELWTFARGANGKPQALFDNAPSPYAISVSHSGPYVACAITEAEAVGIDIEQHKDWRDLKEIADLAFGPEERRVVEREGAPAFYRIWTLREAHAKATGLGLEQAADGQDRFADPVPDDCSLVSMLGDGLSRRSVPRNDEVYQSKLWPWSPPVIARSGAERRDAAIQKTLPPGARDEGVSPNTTDGLHHWYFGYTHHVPKLSLAVAVRSEAPFTDWTCITLSE